MLPFPIHIFDDGMGLCREPRDWLEHAGHKVVCMSSGRVLPAGSADAPPGLFILGITGSKREGLDVYQRLLSHRQLRTVPIIAVSDDPYLEYELLDAYDFHVHPIDRARLLAAVRRLGAAAREGRPPQCACISTDQLTPFRELLLELSGLHFSASNQGLLVRGLLHRIRALQMKTPEKYLAYLTRTGDNQDELNKLLGLLTIGETCFFRYRNHREAMVHLVLPELLERNRNSRRLRIWSAGCSTGEEPYSLAIMLREYFPAIRDWDVHILATDINKRSLRYAREGIYQHRSLRQTEESLRQRYFQQVGEHFVLDSQVRNLVRFGYLNLQDGPFPDAGAGTAGLDLILCRNVLIYFKPEGVRQIVSRFSECLRPGGYLFLGHAETLQHISTGFHRLHQHGAFFYQRKAGEVASPATHRGPDAVPPGAVVPIMPPSGEGVAASAPAPAGVLPRTPSPADGVRLFAAAMTAFDREDYPLADRLFDQVEAAHPQYAQALIGKGFIAANQGRYADARQWCARAIRHDDLCPAAYLLRGLILDMEERLERALVEYQKVLWLDREFVMAYYLSAKVYGRLGQTGLQQRALRNTIRALEKKHAIGIITFSGGLSMPVLLEICRQELATLQQLR